MNLNLLDKSTDTNQIFNRCVEDCYEPIMFTDVRGILTYVNPAWVSTYGYAQNEAVGQTPQILCSEFQTEEFYHSMWNTILDPKIGSWKGEVLNRAKDGHLVPVILTITPYRETNGKISGYMGIAVDLTEQKKMEQQILRQDRLASIGMLSGGLAHEIGNPLGVVRGRTELILSQVQGNQSVAQNVEIILSQIDRIHGLINSLLKVSREPEQIFFQEIDLQQSIDEVCTLMRESCRIRKIQILKSDLDHKILGEPSHFQQIILNLMINSLHAIEEQMQKNTSEPSEHFIQISALPAKDGYCEVSVKDTGCGISKQNLSKLFHPFFTTKAPGKGTGLGLAIVLKHLEEMDGKVTVFSDGPGRGATFRLQLKNI